MKAFLYSMLGRGEISLGGVCIALMVLAYTVLMVLAFALKRTLPVTGYEFASIVAAIYGIKQGTAVANRYYEQKGKVPSADISD